MYHKKIILIGFGRFGKVLSEKLGAISDVAVTITTRDYRKNLQGFDWAVIATPVATHVKIARDCLRAGINVFCEKPLSEDSKEMEKIFELACAKNKKIYIDDVFRWRAEYEKIKQLNLKLEKISFRMTKYGTFNDSLLAAHVYHDVYMLLDLTNFTPISNIKIVKVECPIEPDRIDILEFFLTAGAIQVQGFYDRTQKTKQKIITINDNIVWSDNSIIIDGAQETLQAHDALATMLEEVLTEKTDFAYNNKLALEATKLLSKIKAVCL
jgi:hypothetical protein